MSTVDFHQSIFQQTRRAGWQSRWPAPAPPPAWSPPTPAATGPSCVGSALLQNYHYHHRHSCSRDQLEVLSFDPLDEEISASNLAWMGGRGV